MYVCAKNMHTTTYVCAKTQCKQYLENSWQMYNILQLVLANAKAYKSTSNALQIKHEEFSAQVYACIVNPGPPPTRTPARASTPYEDLLTCYYNVVHMKDDFTVTFAKAEHFFVFTQPDSKISLECHSCVAMVLPRRQETNIGQTLFSRRTRWYTNACHRLQNNNCNATFYL